MSTETTISEQIGGLPPPDSKENVLLTAWEEALGEVLAEQQRRWARERALIEAQATATVAELCSEVAKLRCEFDQMVNERLSGLRDGTPGLPGAPGPRGEPGPPGREGHLRNVTEWSYTKLIGAAFATLAASTNAIAMMVRIPLPWINPAIANSQRQQH
jgi:hypothetical protein